MRFLHTSDWQIGKIFRFVDDETLAILRAERVDVVTRIGKLAQEHGASAVLVAGDIFDVGHVSLETLLKPIERMRQFPAVEWHLIPGNHDAHLANGPWDRLLRHSLPANVFIHVTPEAKAIAGGAAWLIPAVLTQRHVLSDPTAFMDEVQTPDGALRIGLAHGSVKNFGSTETATHNVIAFDRAKTAKLDYLALGDWHGAVSVGARSWYSGSPETDSFDTGGKGGGDVLLVELTDFAEKRDQVLPSVTILPVGRFRWLTEKVRLTSVEDIVALEARLRALYVDLSRVLLRLQVEGTLSLSAREEFERRIQLGLGSALRLLRLETEGLHLKPSSADLEAIDHIGFVRAAADQLTALAENPQNPERELASEAL